MNNRFRWYSEVRHGEDINATRAHTHPSLSRPTHLFVSFLFLPSFLPFSLAIKDRKLLPPLMVLQILSQNPNKQLSVVKDYIIHALQEENDLIKADQEEIQRFQMETQTMREEIHRLHTQPITFQGLKCHQCTSGLSLPALHFVCGHSYHQRCVVDSEHECPKCVQQYRQGQKEANRKDEPQQEREREAGGVCASMRCAFHLCV